MLAFIGLVLVGLGFYMLARRKKYEFQNRTGVGVVGFKSYGASVRHNMKGTLIFLLFAVGFVLIVAEMAVSQLGHH